jgi:signal transduction histidine kinase
MGKAHHKVVKESLAAKPSLLIVDDEKVVLDLCERSLRDYRVFTAESCAEALKAFEREAVDLVLTDVMMGCESGIDLLRQVKMLNPNAAVIIMTAFSEKDVILTALKEGADDFISKPLNLLQLKSAVEKALGRKQLKEELANLKKLDRLKSNFLSLISHKLRTPITSISLFLQNIDQGVYKSGDESLRQNAHLINEETAYLQRLVDDLLAFSQVMVGSEGLKLEKCHLEVVVADVLQNALETHNKPGVETDFIHQHLPAMKLDRQKIGFAIQQIIDNAFKFSGDIGRIGVSFRNSGDRVAVVVADSGVGIPPAELAKVFEKFYQIDPDNTGQVRGFGLGLFYAREFIMQHGGTLGIESEPGRGTTVTIMLPLK